jgi:hypothetical protein
VSAELRPGLVVSAELRPGLVVPAACQVIPELADKRPD